MTDPIAVHLLPLSGAANIRDLGGYPAAKGRFTRLKQFYRGDSTANLTEQDIDCLLAKGLSLVIDLRSPNELVENPSRLQGIAGIHYESIPMYDGIHSIAADSRIAFAGDFPAFMGDLYVHFLDFCQEQYQAIFQLFAANEGAALFHCSAGKDRTGVLAMLLLDLVGVSEGLIVADYSASERYVTTLLTEQLAHLEQLGLNVPAGVIGSPPENMTYTLEHFRKHYGDARQYLLGCGVKAAQLDDLCARFLTNEPTIA